MTRYAAKHPSENSRTRKYGERYVNHLFHSPGFRSSSGVPIEDVTMVNRRGETQSKTATNTYIPANERRMALEALVSKRNNLEDSSATNANMKYNINYVLMLQLT